MDSSCSILSSIFLPVCSSQSGDPRRPTGQAEMHCILARGFRITLLRLTSESLTPGKEGPSIPSRTQAELAAEQDAQPL